MGAKSFAEQVCLPSGLWLHILICLLSEKLHQPIHQCWDCASFCNKVTEKCVRTKLKKATMGHLLALTSYA